MEVDVIGTGSVIVDPVKEKYYYGDIVTLTGTGVDDFIFLQWTGNFVKAPSKAESTDNPLKIVIQGDTSVVAFFAEPISVPLSRYGIYLVIFAMLIAAGYFFRKRIIASN